MASIKYFKAPDIEDKVASLIKNLDFEHIDPFKVVCVRSMGSKSRHIIARCHSVSKIIQVSLNLNSYYIIEVVSEHFDKLPEEEKVKTLIHELMHIPKSFGGGFRHHDFVNRKNVENMYKEYLKKQ